MDGTSVRELLKPAADVMATFERRNEREFSLARVSTVVRGVWNQRTYIATAFSLLVKLIAKISKDLESSDFLILTECVNVELADSKMERHPVNMI